MATYEYEPYWAAYYAFGLPINFGYTGQQFDANTGTYYFLFRHYSPATARWLTREPSGIDGPNLYWYGGSNPSSYVDPDGQSFVGVIGGHKGDWIDQALDWGARIGAGVGTAAAVGAIGIMAIAPAVGMMTIGELGTAALGTGAAHLLFKPGSWLNRGQYLRVGFGRHQGRTTFRCARRIVNKLCGKPHKDICDVGPWPPRPPGT